MPAVTSDESERTTVGRLCLAENRLPMSLRSKTTARPENDARLTSDDGGV